MRLVLASIALVVAIGWSVGISARDPVTTTATSVTPVADLIHQEASRLVDDGVVRGISVGFLDLEAGDRVVGHFGEPEGGAAYGIASVSKIFVAMVASQLVAEGKLDLETPLADVLPDFSLRRPHPASPPITVRHLLTHTSGLSRDRIAGMQSHCVLDDRYLLSHFAEHHQSLPAGYRHAYSNPGIELLGYALEEVSGQAFTDLVADRILRPMALGSTSYSDDEPLGLPRAPSYMPGSGEPVPEPPIRYTAAGGLTSTADDLLDVVEMLLSDGLSRGTRVLDRDAVEAMFRHQNRDVALDTDVMMGLAWFLEDLPEPYRGRLVHHGGGSIMLNAMTMLAPEYGMAAVVLAATAGSYPAVDGLARQILFAALEARTGEPPRDQLAQDPAPEAWSADRRAEARGRFATASEILEIGDRDGRLVVRTGDAVHLARTFDDASFSYSDAFRLHVRQVGEERILFLTGPAGTQPIGRETSEPLAVPGAWLRAQGEYRLTGTCPEGEVVFYERIRLHVRDNVLRASLHLGPMPASIFGVTAMHNVLIPRGDDVAVMAGFGRYPGEAVYLETAPDGATVVSFAGLRFTASR